MTTRKGRAAILRQQRKISTPVYVTGGFLVLIFVLFLLSSYHSNTMVGPAQVGKPLGNFSLTDITGKIVHLNDYAEQTVLVNAWATWCPPCRAEMPDLNTYYQAHQNKGFMILAVDAGDSASDAAAFAGQNNLPFPVLLYPDLHLLTSLGIHSLPTSILVGSDGVVKTIHIGMFTPV
jgi:thiol-disulfide isomerase/thioredoxin